MTGIENREYIKSISSVMDKSIHDFTYNFQKRIFKFLIGFFKEKGISYNEIVEKVDKIVVELKSIGGVLIYIYWNGKNRRSIIPFSTIDPVYKIDLEKLLYPSPNADRLPIYYTKDNIKCMIDYLRHILKTNTTYNFNFGKYFKND